MGLACDDTRGAIRDAVAECARPGGRDDPAARTVPDLILAAAYFDRERGANSVRLRQFRAWWLPDTPRLQGFWAEHCSWPRADG